jgi:hypothetical protein
MQTAAAGRIGRIAFYRSQSLSTLEHSKESPLLKEERRGDPLSSGKKVVKEEVEVLLDGFQK